MKLSFIEMEGFRGVRSHLRINLPEGFLVVTGRNGSGKSTLCDAVEYALTGLISKYEDSKERGESTEQYVWWRGAAPAAKNFVRIGIRDEGVGEFTITRTPAGAEVSDGRDPTSSLCDLSLMTRNPLSQLCRTAIIRDETVAAMSIDMAEVDRFTFVRTALGTDALDEVANRGPEVLAAMKKEVQAAAASYEKARERVTSLLADISKARALVAEQPDVGAAEDTLRRLIGQDIREPNALLVAARQRVTALRRSADAALRLVGTVQELQAEADRLASAAAQAEIVALRSKRDQLTAERERLSTDLTALEARAAADSVSASVRSRIATLLDVGRSVGLRNGSCPLCATAQTSSAFESAIESLAAEVAEADQQAASVRRQIADLSRRLEFLEAERSSAEVALRRFEGARQENERRLALAAEQLRVTGVPVDAPLDAESLLAHISNSQAQLNELSTAVSVLEASAGLEKIAVLDRDLQQARALSDALEARLRQVEDAESRAKKLLKGVRRAVGEVVEERLAGLDPLLKDLYSRLRPHSDWTELSYKVRGDVRKFLSLRVGEEVNPRFTFSSGQRRAIGLAFLLAVHLSRPWCRLRTLILDDPIQHIDDFRSLHLVEVLGAIRKAGQQVICAVEDEELAELICRRARAGSESDGLLVRMAYRAGEGAVLDSATRVQPAVQHLVVPW